MTGAVQGLSIAELRDIWNKVSRQHMSLGGACACSFGVAISGADLEEDICDYLEDAARRERRTDVLEALSKVSISTAYGRLDAVLGALERDSSGEAALFAIPRLAGSLQSLAAQHIRQGFRCD